MSLWLVLNIYIYTYGDYLLYKKLYFKLSIFIFVETEDSK